MALQEALSSLGLPTTAVVVMVGIIVLSRQYFDHRLSIEREKAAVSVKLLSELQARRIDVLNEFFYLQEDFTHEVQKASKGRGHEMRLRHQSDVIRAFSRRNVLTLGDDFIQATYRFTDAGLECFSGDFDLQRFHAAWLELRDEEKKVVSTITLVPHSAWMGSGSDALGDPARISRKLTSHLESGDDTVESMPGWSKHL